MEHQAPLVPATSLYAGQQQRTQPLKRNMQHLLQDASLQYGLLLWVFQYLPLQELLRARRVCRM